LIYSTTPVATAYLLLFDLTDNHDQFAIYAFGSGICVHADMLA